MKLRLCEVLAVLVIIALCISPAIAESPVLPMSVYGTVEYATGEPVTVGTTITADVDGIISTYTVEEINKIGEDGTFGEKFIVSGGVSGSAVNYSIGNVKATNSNTFVSGTSLNVNLVFDVKKTQIDIATSTATSSYFKDKPTLLTNGSATVPSDIKVNVDIITDTSGLPSTPENTTTVKVFDISVENAESLGGEYSLQIPISITDNELQTSFKNNRDAVIIFHNNSGVWESMPIIKIEKKSGYTNFYIWATSFSAYMLGVNTASPIIPPEEKPYSGSSSKSGSSTTIEGWTPTPTPTPSVVSTPIQTPVAESTPIPIPTSAVNPTTKPTQQSPAPLAGLIAGLGAAALFLGRLRK